MAGNNDEPDIYKRPVEILQQLIGFDTTNPPGNELECVNYVDNLLSEGGFETTQLSRDPNRPNLITRLEGKGNAPPLLLHGHVDVVTTEHQEWRHPPFEARVADGYVWGRGALDMKGGVAMMLACLLRAKAEGLTPEGDVVLAIMSDEEAGGDDGAKYLVENHANLFQGIRYALGEFGGFPLYLGGRKFYLIQVGEKQICWMKATGYGRGGHGSFPPRDGAMPILGRLLQQLGERRLPVHITPVTRQMFETMASALPSPTGPLIAQLLEPAQTDSALSEFGDLGPFFGAMLRNTVAPTVLHGSEKINVVPSEVAVDLDGRLLPGFTFNDMVDELQGVLPEGVHLDLIRHDPNPSEPDLGLFDTLAHVLQAADSDGVPVPMLMPGVTDGRFFSRLGIQTYGFLPMDLPQDFNFLQTIHAANERIPQNSLEFGSEAIYQVIQRYGR